MIAPYDHQALWTKAKLFINRAMDDDGRTFDERSLWAALSLELLAKAALARISPLLIAEPSEEGVNLLIASGLIQGEARFNSVRAHTLYSRCQRAFKPFNASEAMAITNGRNEYLHGGGIGFTNIPQSVWWPKFWAQASVLIGALDREARDLVGPDRSEIVERHLAQNARNIEHRTEALIERARQRLAQHRAGTLPARVAGEWRSGTDLSLGLKYRQDAPCPACKSPTGQIEGDNVDDSEIIWEQVDHDDFDVRVEVTVAADYFSCDTCRLILDSYELLEQAGIPASFVADGDPEDFLEEEYGND